MLRRWTTEGLAARRRASSKARSGVAPVSWTRGFGSSGCSVGSVGLGGGAVVEAGLVA